MKKIILIGLFFTLNSCGLFEMINGYEKYVLINNYGRKELVKKKYQTKFDTQMLNQIDIKKVYYNYYEDKSINWFYHEFLRLFPNGQYAIFHGKKEELEIRNLNKASHIGYYIVEKGILKLETPTGNFNTARFRVIKKYKIDNYKLIEFKKAGMTQDTLIGENIDILLSDTPDW
ncbi:hypothetical protein [Nonlabens ulvanivorans]|uniref:hypothetical protein n=1 Tax=Nonlabens ulvanivorans TaxID=906888 RepID=UPI002942A414|nr:hypothetical protein [Nonlabens ulvanivorans]WOI23495.1 hypothetical protein R1T42_03370 [Nonlabens ulvanivorans]